MINICNDSETQGSSKKMTAEFHRDGENEVVIDSCTLDKGVTNRLSKARQKEVLRYLKAHAGKEFEVSHGSKIELVFRDDGTKVLVTFKQKQ